MSDFKIVSLLNPVQLNSGVIAVSAGTSSQSTGTLVFANSNNMTFGLNNGTLTASFSTAGGGGGVALSAGTNSTATGTVVFNNSNGVTFGMDTAGVVTATVKTDYQPAGAYLTTAMASNRGSDFVQATAAFAGTNASGTIASNGISVSVAAQSVQPVAASAANGSYNFSTLKFVDTNGVSFITSTDGVRATVATNYQSAGAYLTTARASNDAIGLNSALTANGVSVTANSSGLSLNFPAFLTTAAQSDHSHGNPTLNLTNLSGTTASNSAGFTLSLSADNYLTTAMASNRGSDFVAASAAFAGTNAAGTIASNGISVSVAAQSTQSAIKGFGVSNTGQTAGNTGISTGIDWVLAGSQSITLSQSTAAGGPNTVWFQHPAWLTTARASNDAIGLNTAQSNVTWTVNSSGLSFDARGYAGTGTSATNASVTLNSDGLAISVAAPGGGGSINFSAGTTSGNLASVTFANSNGVSFGLNAGTITGTVATTYLGSNAGSNFVAATAAFAGTNASGTIASNGISVSVAAPGAAAEVNAINLLGANTAGNTTATGSTIGWSGGNGVTLSGTNNSQVVISVSTYNTIGTATTGYPVASADSVGTVSRWAAEDHRHAGIGALGISTSGNTAGTTGSVQGTYWIQGGNNITVSQITSNNGSHTLVLSGPNTVAGTTLSTFEPVPFYGLSTNTIAINAATSGSVSIWPFIVKENVSAGAMNMMFTANFTTVGTSSGRQTAGIAVGLSTRGAGANSTRLESVASTSFSWQVTGNNSSYTINQVTQTAYSGYGATGATNSAGVNITSGYTGGKLVAIPMNILLTPGVYWLGIIGTNSTSSVNVGLTMGYLGAVMNTLQSALAPIGSFSSAYSTGADPNGGRWHIGHGVWTSAGSVTNLPASIAFASISAAAASVIPAMKFWRT